MNASTDIMRVSIRVRQGDGGDNLSQTQRLNLSSIDGITHSQLAISAIELPGDPCQTNRIPSCIHLGTSIASLWCKMEMEPPCQTVRSLASSLAPGKSNQTGEAAFVYKDRVPRYSD